jgi:hypothetical protein
MRRRIHAAGALFLTAFFAAAGAFHHHPLPKTTHDHAGFCSAASATLSIESCALCRVAHTTADLAARAVAPLSTDAVSRFASASTLVPPSAGAALLCDSRAPPAV